MDSYISMGGRGDSRGASVTHSSSPDPLALSPSEGASTWRTARSPSRSNANGSPTKSRRRDGSISLSATKSSPSKSIIMTTGGAQGASPWRIKVTVEASPQDAENIDPDDETPSPSARRRRSTTTRVPLKDSDDRFTPKKQGRPRKSSTRKPRSTSSSRTPARRKSALGESEDMSAPCELTESDLDPSTPIRVNQRRARPVRNKSRDLPGATDEQETDWVLPPVDNTIPQPAIESEQRWPILSKGSPDAIAGQESWTEAYPENPAADHGTDDARIATPCSTSGLDTSMENFGCRTFEFTALTPRHPGAAAGAACLRTSNVSRAEIAESSRDVLLLDQASQISSSDPHIESEEQSASMFSSTTRPNTSTLAVRDRHFDDFGSDHGWQTSERAMTNSSSSGLAAASPMESYEPTRAQGSSASLGRTSAVKGYKSSDSDNLQRSIDLSHEGLDEGPFDSPDSDDERNANAGAVGEATMFESEGFSMVSIESLQGRPEAFLISPKSHQTPQKTDFMSVGNMSGNVSFQSAKKTDPKLSPWDSMSTKNVATSLTGGRHQYPSSPPVINTMRTTPSAQLISPAMPPPITQTQVQHAKVPTPQANRARRSTTILQDVISNESSAGRQQQGSHRRARTEIDPMFTGFGDTTLQELQAGLRLGETLAHQPPSNVASPSRFSIAATAESGNDDVFAAQADTASSNASSIQSPPQRSQYRLSLPRKSLDKNPEAGVSEHRPAREQLPTPEFSSDDQPSRIPTSFASARASSSRSFVPSQRVRVSSAKLHKTEAAGKKAVRHTDSKKPSDMVDMWFEEATRSDTSLSDTSLVDGFVGGDDSSVLLPKRSKIPMSLRRGSAQLSDPLSGEIRHSQDHAPPAKSSLSKEVDLNTEEMDRSVSETQQSPVSDLTESELVPPTLSMVEVPERVDVHASESQEFIHEPSISSINGSSEIPSPESSAITTSSPQQLDISQLSDAQPDSTTRSTREESVETTPHQRFGDSSDGQGPRDMKNALNSSPPTWLQPVNYDMVTEESIQASMEENIEASTEDSSNASAIDTPAGSVRTDGERLHRDNSEASLALQLRLDIEAHERRMLRRQHHSTTADMPDWSRRRQDALDALHHQSQPASSVPSDDRTQAQSSGPGILSRFTTALWSNLPSVSSSASAPDPKPHVALTPSSGPAKRHPREKAYPLLPRLEPWTRTHYQQLDRMYQRHKRSPLTWSLSPAAPHARHNAALLVSASPVILNYRDCVTERWGYTYKLEEELLVISALFCRLLRLETHEEYVGPEGEGIDLGRCGPGRTGDPIWEEVVVERLVSVVIGEMIREDEAKGLAIDRTGHKVVTMATGERIVSKRQ